MSKKEKKIKGKREREGGSVTLSRSEIYASMCQCFCPYSHHGLVQAIHSYSSYIHPSTQSRSDIFLRSLPPPPFPLLRIDCVHTRRTTPIRTSLSLSLSRLSSSRLFGCYGRKARTRRRLPCCCVIYRRLCALSLSTENKIKKSRWMNWESS